MKPDRRSESADIRHSFLFSSWQRPSGGRLKPRKTNDFPRCPRADASTH